MVVLDLGCGVNKKAGAVGVDRRRLPSVDVVCDLNYGFLPFRDGCADTIYSSHVLEHLKDPVAFMKEARRVMSDNGKAILTLPLAGSPASFQSDHRSFFRARDFYYYEVDNKCHYYVAEAGRFRLEEVKYRHGFPIYLQPLWLFGTLIQMVLNLNIRTVREIYENYLLTFFPMAEFTVTLRKDQSM